MSDISMLERREIQEPLAACIIRGFASMVGNEKALEIVVAAIGAGAEAAGKKAADKFGGNALRELGRVVRKL